MNWKTSNWMSRATGDLELPEKEPNESDAHYAARLGEAREEQVQQYWEEKLEELQSVNIEAP